METGAWHPGLHQHETRFPPGRNVLTCSDCRLVPRGFETVTCETIMRNPPTPPPPQLVAGTEVNLSLSAPEENVPGLSDKTHQKSRRAATGQVATSRNQGLVSNLNWRVGLRKVLCPNLLLHSRFSAGTTRSLLLFSLR